MSDDTEQYIERARQETQFTSPRTAINETLRLQGWEVQQVNFTAGSRSQTRTDCGKTFRSSKSRRQALRH
jgi:hypothetical protein